MSATIRIQVIDDCGKSRTLTLTGGSRDQDETSFDCSDFLEHRRETQFVERWNTCGNHAKDCSEFSLVPENIEAKATKLRHIKGSVQLFNLLKIYRLRGTENERFAYGRHVLVGEGIDLNGDKIPLDPQNGRGTDSKMNITRFLLDGKAQQALQVCLFAHK
jgi:hypothetical protein